MKNVTESVREPIAVVEDFFAAMQAMDMERGAALLHDEVVYQNVPLPADRGKAATLRTLQRFGRVVDRFEVKMVNIAARGPIVLTERVDVLSGPWLYLDLWVCGTFEVRDGLIVLWRDYFDVATATAKLALSPIKRVLGLIPR
jgi:limonene-1,2-epoxide hydrolase